MKIKIHPKSLPEHVSNRRKPSSWTLGMPPQKYFHPLTPTRSGGTGSALEPKALSNPLCGCIRTSAQLPVVHERSDY
jgi:hypothetical protein